MDDIKEIRERVRRLEARLGVAHLDNLISQKKESWADGVIALLQESRPRRLGVGVLISEEIWDRIETKLQERGIAMEKGQ